MEPHVVLHGLPPSDRRSHLVPLRPSASLIAVGLLLRVVDTSIMPQIVNADTNGPVIIISEKASDLILGRA
jgi:hypothetical protein